MKEGLSEYKHICLKKGLGEYKHIKFQGNMTRNGILVFFPFLMSEFTLRQDWCPGFHFYEVMTYVPSSELIRKDSLTEF